MNQNELRIDIAHTPTKLAKEWVAQVNTELETLATGTGPKEAERWRKRSIYKIPASMITEHYKNVYAPHLVSIGPYHYGEERLKAMEEHKHRALLCFLRRSRGKPLQSYVDALAEVVEDLKDAYDQLDGDKWEDSGEFLQLMIVDGCFILEILRATSGESKDCLGYEEDDPVFSKHGKIYIVPYLKRDMLMLENQIPMQVLTTLLAVEKGMPLSEQHDAVTNLILNFFSQSDTKIGNTNSLHILDVFRKSLLSTNPKPRKSTSGGKGHDAIIRSATELTEAGIEIKQSKSRSLKDITFHRGLFKGVLKLPLIVVDDTLESQYLNMMAFERFHVGAGNDVTSYVFFMDSIIDSAKDVSQLHSGGVIQNALGSDKAVANLFNTISKDIALDPESSLEYVHKEVSEYCRKRLHRWMAYAKHNYFTNPLVSASVVAAAFLFALTITQTVYSALDYYKPDN